MRTTAVTVPGLVSGVPPEQVSVAPLVKQAAEAFQSENVFAAHDFWEFVIPKVT